jgi:hypothetical protein
MRERPASAIKNNKVLLINTLLRFPHLKFDNPLLPYLQLALVSTEC